MVRASLMGWLLSVAGCSLLFDGNALLPDASAPTPPADLSATIDMAMPSVDLAVPTNDLAPSCTGPLVFNGFGDAGAIDCPCGCTLDPFTAAPSSVRWTQSGNAGWSVTAANGALDISRALASNGDGWALAGNYQFEGDFDLRLDYFRVNVPNGGRAQMVAYGPLVGSSYEPTAYGLVYSTGAALRFNLAVDDIIHDVGGANVAGTLRIYRAGGLTCAEAPGRDTNCVSVPMPRLRWYFVVSEANAACVSCGPLDFSFTNARLVTGRLVPP